MQQKKLAAWRILLAAFVDRFKLRLVGEPTPDEMEKPTHALHTLQCHFEFVKGSIKEVELEANRILANSEAALGVDIKRYSSGSVSGELLSVKHKQGEVFILALNYKVKLPRPISLNGGRPQVKLLTHKSLTELGKLVNAFAREHAVISANLGFHGNRATTEEGVWFIQVNYLV